MSEKTIDYYMKLEKNREKKEIEYLKKEIHKKILLMKNDISYERGLGEIYDVPIEDVDNRVEEVRTKYLPEIDLLRKEVSILEAKESE